MPAYFPAPEVETIAKEIIQKHRPYLGHVKITYMFRPEGSVTDDKVIAGMCVRVDDRNRSVHDYDFIIEIAKDVWDEAPTEEFKTALVDHELGHAGIRMDEEGDVRYDEKTNRPKTYIKKHDIEEFEDVLDRHGAYHKALRNFLDAFARNKARKKSKTDEENLTSSGSPIEDDAPAPGEEALVDDE